MILEGEAWAGSLGSRSLRAAGVHVALAPLAERAPPVEPLLRFGVEALTVDDDQERGPAFVAGVDLRAGGGGWFVEGGVRNHFLRVEDSGPEPEERDASVWEARLTTGWAWGGDGG